MNIKIIHNANEATGVAIIIDVFRAFTVEPYLINNGAKKIIPVEDKQVAYEYKEKNNDYVLIGEREGIKLQGFDYGNSPSQIENIDFTGKVIIHTTSCGTKGISRAVNAKEIITGSLVNSKAISEYIKKNNFEDVSIVSLARSGEEAAEEDELCAKYIKSLLEDNPLPDLETKIESLKSSSGAKFFDKSIQEVFPERDFYLCTEVNKFSFVLKINKDENGCNYVEKVFVD